MNGVNMSARAKLIPKKERYNGMGHPWFEIGN
jgi:hypothetical protein